MLAGSEYLRTILGAERLTAVVDVGANPIDGDPPYLDMLRSELCTVTGFEPQAAALSVLEERKGSLETYLPDAVGDGNDHVLHLTAASGMTSFFEPDGARLGLFGGFPEWGSVVERITLATRRLDDIEDVAAMDMLKIDVQGAELMVFAGARRRLHDAVTVHTEVSFVPLYHDQPTFGDIDLELRGLGFIPHALSALKRWPIAPVVYDGDVRKPMHQLLEADVVYVRDFTHPDDMSVEQLQHLALIAHCVYGSSDLTHRCLQALGERSVTPAGAPGEYLARTHGRPAG